MLSLNGLWYISLGRFHCFHSLQHQSQRKHSRRCFGKLCQHLQDSAQGEVYQLDIRKKAKMLITLFSTVVWVLMRVSSISRIIKANGNGCGRVKYKCKQPNRLHLLHLTISCQRWPKRVNTTYWRRLAKTILMECHHAVSLGEFKTY